VQVNQRQKDKEAHIGLKRLTVAVIGQAILDFHYIKSVGGMDQIRERQRKYGPKKGMNVGDAGSAISFLASQSFDNLANWVSLDPDVIREKIGFKR
jgi:hypothetical protein